LLIQFSTGLKAGETSCIFIDNLSYQTVAFSTWFVAGFTIYYQMHNASSIGKAGAAIGFAAKETGY
jgi:hypothetical protein